MGAPIQHDSQEQPRQSPKEAESQKTQTQSEVLSVELTDSSPEPLKKRARRGRLAPVSYPKEDEDLSDEEASLWFAGFGWIVQRSDLLCRRRRKRNVTRK